MSSQFSRAIMTTRPNSTCIDALSASNLGKQHPHACCQSDHPSYEHLMKCLSAGIHNFQPTPTPISGSVDDANPSKHSNQSIKATFAVFAEATRSDQFRSNSTTTGSFGGRFSFRAITRLLIATAREHSRCTGAAPNSYVQHLFRRPS